MTYLRSTIPGDVVEGLVPQTIVGPRNRLLVTLMGEAESCQRGKAKQVDQHGRDDSSIVYHEK